MESLNKRGDNAPTRYLMWPKKSSSTRNQLHLEESLIKWSYEIFQTPPFIAKVTGYSLWPDLKALLLRTILVSLHMEKLSNWCLSEASHLLTRAYGIGKNSKHYQRRGYSCRKSQYLVPTSNGIHLPVIPVLGFNSFFGPLRHLHSSVLTYTQYKAKYLFKNLVASCKDVYSFYI